MTEQIEQQQLVRKIYEYAADLKRQGKSSKQIEEALKTQGLDNEISATVVRNIESQYAEVNKEKGRKNMIYGALWCGGGILVTAITYSSASGGGTYIITWGAIIFGAVQFIVGLTQISKSKQPSG